MLDVLYTSLFVAMFAVQCLERKKFLEFWSISRYRSENIYISGDLVLNLTISDSSLLGRRGLTWSNWRNTGRLNRIKSCRLSDWFTQYTIVNHKQLLANTNTQLLESVHHYRLFKTFITTSLCVTYASCNSKMTPEEERTQPEKLWI